MGSPPCTEASGLLRAGYSPDQQGLLFLRNAIPNFAWYQQTVPCTGWDSEPVGADDICTWDGVGCNSALQVVSIKFPNNASLLEGEAEARCSFRADL